MRPVVTYPDVERQAVDDLDDALGDLGETVTVGIGVPTDWTPGDTTHAQVALDGTPRDLHPVAQQSTIRVTVWASGPTEAKRVANLAHGLLLALPSYKRLTGLLATRDPQTRADLASFTVRANVRSTPIEGEGS